MNILVISDAFWPDHTGGISKSLLTEVEELALRGNRVVVATRKLNNNHQDREERNGYQLYRYTSPSKDTNFYRLYPLFSIRELPKLINQLRCDYHFDVAYVHNPFQAIGLLRCPSRIPYVYVFHAPTTREIELDSEKGKYGRLTPLVRVANQWIKNKEKRALMEAKAIIVRSKFMESEMHMVHGNSIGRDKTICIPLCVNTQYYSSGDTCNARKELHLPPDRPILLTVRRLVARMGLENLIIAMKYVARDTPNALLLIGGKGYCEKALKRQIHELNLESNILFLGFISDNILPKYYQAADLVIMPTEALEGFGLTTLEAMSCGAPVIATPVGANPEVAGILGDGFLCRDTSPEALAERILWFFKRPYDQKLRDICRAQCLSNNRPEKVVGDIEKVLQLAAQGGK